MSSEPVNIQRSVWETFNPFSDAFKHAESDFHQLDGWRRAIVVIASIVGGLFLVVGAFPVFCWVAKELKEGENETAYKTSQTAMRTSPFQDKEKIEKGQFSQSLSVLSNKIGGFHNPDQCCFLISALQAMRQVPALNKRLEGSFEPLKGEAKERFELRGEIRSKIGASLEKTGLGENVSAKETQLLDTLLRKLAVMDGKHLGLGGEGGDLWEACQTIFHSLGMEAGSDYVIAFHPQMIEEKVGEFQWIEDFEARDEECRGLNQSTLRPEIVLIKRDAISLSYAPCRMIEIPGEKGSCRYVLVAAIADDPSQGAHSITYLRDLHDEKELWVKCDDHETSKKYAHLPNTQDVTGFVYTCVS